MRALFSGLGKRMELSSDQPAAGNAGQDPRANLIATVVACIVVLGAPVLAGIVEGQALMAVRTLLCAACIFVGVRRWCVLSVGEMWIFANLAMLYNPIYPFQLYERDR
jgi:hypothetical protein